MQLNTIEIFFILRGNITFLILPSNFEYLTFTSTIFAFISLFRPGTQTVRALQYAANTAFQADFGDRPEAENVAIFVTDGVSSDNREVGNTNTLTIAANMLKARANVVSRQ